MQAPNLLAHFTTTILHVTAERRTTRLVIVVGKQSHSLACDCREKNNTACSDRCKAVPTCGCSYYEHRNGFCTLMWGGDDFGDDAGRSDAVACSNVEASRPGIMHYEPRKELSNSVNEICCHECDPDGGYGYDDYY